MNARRAGQGGFTIIEVMTVVAIIAFLAAVAIPNLTQTIKNSKLRGTASDLFGDLLTARSEAVKRNCNVYVQPTNSGDWSSGWNVTTAPCSVPFSGTIAAVQVAAHPALDSDVKAYVSSGTAGQITYNSSGRVSAGAQTIDFYESASGVFARCVAVDSSGQPRITVDTVGDQKLCQ